MDIKDSAVNSDQDGDNNKNTDDQFQTSRVASLGLVHFLHDIYTSFLSPILPILIEKMSLSLTQAGSLSVFMQFPSLFNPFFGALADRKKLNKWFVIVTPAVTAILMCLIGVAPNYSILAMLLLAAGFSVALIHVSAPVMVATLSGKAVGRGMGFFMLGGELARTIGPLLAVWAATTFGPEGMWRLIPVGILTSFVLWLKADALPSQPSTKDHATIKEMLKSMRFVIGGIFGILIARAFIASAISTFLPTFMFQEGNSLIYSGVALSIVELAGAAGVLISGTLSDFIGRRKILFAGIILSPLLMLAMLNTSGVLLVFVLMGLGFSILSTGPVMMAIMLENAGENKSAANGIFMAISFAIRASVVLLVGTMSDKYGLRDAFTVCAFVGLLGLPFILMLPKSRKL